MTPPTGKAMVLTQALVDVFADPSPGPSQNIELFKGPSCGGDVFADVNPPTVGVTVLPLDPGIGVPSGSAVSTFASGSVEAELYLFGYAVSSASVPASAPAETTGVPRQNP
jgi:hypothetical protein